ncbi:hypothetical protein TWF696_004482 [Orbilia brochopaga]|uniref:Uncharacterized protein n=1 Tax=Orbilia brochopaga TaxID=3140254 RepID=A0AAV9V853_9PEZI
MEEMKKCDVLGRAAEVGPGCPALSPPHPHRMSSLVLVLTSSSSTTTITLCIAILFGPLLHLPARPPSRLTPVAPTTTTIAPATRMKQA